ncbi:cytochrome c5 family protein [Sinimarinibacterium sp. CAU 1509]|uniref:c-type cytochrome n=1 Tax=Sinimarinibacterium sp. CAU 1509 TaxID=2562283 RepID=UPI0010ACA62C|nr:c-type cytochrome [Sinimarinibacterium sp. CAU 1509]TJY56230.1 cytochrome c5 family protein [Sinimarinibacterium sp. CAU 1509]
MSIQKSASVLLFLFSAAATAGVPAGKGEEIVKKSCAMCHQMPGMGAPVVGNKADWTARIAQGKPTLYDHAIKGFQGAKGVMPPKGANPALTDDEIKAAVDYMVGQIK